MIISQHKFKLKVTPECLGKIQKTCQRIPDVEWSGVAIYKGPQNCSLHDITEIELVDFFPMSKDTKAHTDFQYDAEHIVYMETNGCPADECRRGLIHSHNTMGVFFSGEDNSELEDNSKHYDYYFSVIVNNKGDILARIAQEVDVNYEMQFNTASKKRMSMKVPATKKEIFVIESDYQPTPSVKFNDDWETQLDAIIAKAAAKAIPNSQWGAYGGYQSQFDFPKTYTPPKSSKPYFKTTPEEMTPLQEAIVDEILTWGVSEDEETFKDYCANYQHDKDLDVTSAIENIMVETIQGGAKSISFNGIIDAIVKELRVYTNKEISLLCANLNSLKV